MQNWRQHTWRMITSANNQSSWLILFFVKHVKADDYGKQILWQRYIFKRARSGITTENYELSRATSPRKKWSCYSGNDADHHQSLSGYAVLLSRSFSGLLDRLPRINLLFGHKSTPLLVLSRICWLSFWWKDKSVIKRLSNTWPCITQTKMRNKYD